MKKNTLVLAILMLGYTAFAQNTNTLLNNYLSVKNALVSGDEKTSTQATSTLYQSIQAESNFAQKEALLTATEKLVKASSIEKQRAVFNDVSTNMWTLVKSTTKVSQPVYYQYCPMKKAYWLSNEAAIKNPYYGSSMLTCGKVSETKN